ncbi:MAG TPA: hypothetical protein VHE59_05460 [Mucilaginibacter sp.]|nr:hypothetical protein [Mucilaginibacter sp.]
MGYDKLMGLLTTIGTVGAVVVAMIAIYRSDKNSKQQILVGKLEELFETVRSLGLYYGVFHELNGYLLAHRDTNSTEMSTRSEYIDIRDKKLSEGDRELINKYLSKIEVLAKCYTQGALQVKCLNYQDIMYAFADFVFNGGSIYKEINYRNGFPKFEEFYSQLEDLKKEIVLKIKLK